MKQSFIYFFRTNGPKYYGMSGAYKLPVGSKLPADAEIIAQLQYEARVEAIDREYKRQLPNASMPFDC